MWPARSSLRPIGVTFLTLARFCREYLTRRRRLRRASSGPARQVDRPTYDETAPPVNQAARNGRLQVAGSLGASHAKAAGPPQRARWPCATGSVRKSVKKRGRKILTTRRRLGNLPNG